jgi:hypothetical protein
LPTLPAQHQFRTPADVLTGAVAKLNVSGSPLLGEWYNVDKATRGLVDLTIAANGSEITIAAQGACSPAPCPWPATAGLQYSANVSSSDAIAFSVTFEFGFSQVLVCGYLRDDKSLLCVESFTHFTDDSGRAAYFARYDMTKSRPA